MTNASLEFSSFYWILVIKSWLVRQRKKLWLAENNLFYVKPAEFNINYTISKVQHLALKCHGADEHLLQDSKVFSFNISKHIMQTDDYSAQLQGFSWTFLILLCNNNCPLSIKYWSSTGLCLLYNSVVFYVSFGGTSRCLGELTHRVSIMSIHI